MNQSMHVWKLIMMTMIIKRGINWSVYYLATLIMWKNIWWQVGKVNLSYCLIGSKIINQQVHMMHMSTMYKNYESVIEIKFLSYIYKRNKCIIAFIPGKCFRYFFSKRIDDQLQDDVTCIIEWIYYLRSLNIVLPFVVCLTLSNI